MEIENTVSKMTKNTVMIVSTNTQLKNSSITNYISQPYKSDTE